MRETSKSIFSHPDFTVGQGISPCRLVTNFRNEFTDLRPKKNAYRRYGITPIPKNKFDMYYIILFKCRGG